MNSMTDEAIRAFADGNPPNGNIMAAAPNLARTVIALHAQLADAQAAQAMVVERCAEVMDQKWFIEDSMRDAIKAEIRALAPASGVEALAALRAENKRLTDAVIDAEAERDRLAAEVVRLEAANRGRKKFPVLKGDGASVDFQLVADHAEQAKANHYQSVDTLAKRGGLSWSELYAVLHNRKWEKIETNEAIVACRALEAHYLAALTTDIAKTRVQP